jgi:hypothetical protein
VLIEQNVVRANVMVVPFDFIDQLIRENHWGYIYSCSGTVYPSLVWDFYGYMEVVQDDQSGLTLQTIVRGITFRVDPTFIGRFIRVDPIPFEVIPFPNSVDPPSMEELLDFFAPHRAHDRVTHSIRIDLFSSPHRLLANIVLHNLWPIAQRSELVFKGVRFLYAMIHRIPFCLCKHIVLTMLEMTDDHQTCLPFACLVTKICMNFVSNIPDSKPKEKTKDTLGKDTVLKSDAQLRDEGHGEVEFPPPIPPVQSVCAATSSSHIAPRSPASDVMLSRILDTVLSIQWDVNHMSVRIEQNHINIRRCLKKLDPEDDDEDD